MNDVNNANDMRKIVYIDMDDTVFDFSSKYEEYQEYYGIDYPQSMGSFFKELQPIEHSIEVINYLKEHFQVYFLTAPSIKNILCYTDKAYCIRQYFGEDMLNNLIITSHKHLNIGDYLIDDNVSGKGQDKFNGELIHYRSTSFPNWNAINDYFSCIK